MPTVERRRRSSGCTGCPPCVPADATRDGDRRHEQPPMRRSADHVQPDPTFLAFPSPCGLLVSGCPPACLGPSRDAPRAAASPPRVAAAADRERLRDAALRRRRERLLDRAEDEVERERGDHVDARRGRVEHERLERRSSSGSGSRARPRAGRSR